MIAANTVNQLEKILQHQFETASQLFTVIKKEHEALKENALENIVSLAEQKSRLTAELDQAYQQQQQLYPATDYTTLNEAFHNEPRISALLAKCRDILKQCETWNQINGRLIMLARQFSQEALAVLTGTTGQAAVYSRNGKTENAELSRSHTKV